MTDVYRAPEDFLGKGEVATTSSDVSPQALTVIEAGLAGGVEAHRSIRAARMLQDYELMFWDTLLALSAREA